MVSGGNCGGMISGGGCSLGGVWRTPRILLLCDDKGELLLPLCCNAVGKDCEFECFCSMTGGTT